VKTKKILFISSAILFGVGLSTLLFTILYNIWEIQPQKALLMMASTAIVLAVDYYFLLRKAAGNGLPDSFPALCGILLLTVALVTSVVALPAGKMPDSRQFIEIKPAESRPDSVVLVEEIRINNEPVLLNTIKPDSGWQTTEWGLQSEPGAQIPLTLTHDGRLQTGIKILLVRGPDYSPVSLRSGWRTQVIDLNQPGGYTELSVDLPVEIPETWDFLLRLSLFFSSGGLLVLFAAWFSQKKNVEFLAAWSQSIFFWIILGFLFWYGYSFTRVVFFNADGMMANANFLPAIRPVGNDLNLILDASRSVLSGGSVYAGANKYPPLATLLFIPLAFLQGDAPFHVLTLINYLCYAFITLVFPLILSGRKYLPVYAWFLAAAGLYSYGLLFEIERGQFNLVAMTCAFAAILIFRRLPRLRWLAYVLLTVAIQLKIYPAVFVVFFVDDWKQWKTFLLRWVLLGLANMAVLFICGVDTALHYIQAMTTVVTSLGINDWPVSHSVSSFLDFSNYYMGIAPVILRAAQITLQIGIIAMMGYTLVNALRKNHLTDPYVLLACTLTALTIPALSNDYTLSYLVGPAIYLFMHLESKQDKGEQRLPILPAALISLCLAGTYFSYFQKPIPLQNHFPALLVILICTVVLSIREFRLKESD
jgi:hypothetical protein